MEKTDVLSIVSRTDTFAPVEAAVSASYSRFCINTDLARVLSRFIILGGCRRILEFGSGLSSVVIAEALSAAGGGRLTAIEHEPRYSRESWQAVSRKRDVDAKMITSPLRLAVTRAGVLYRYSSAQRQLAERGPYDLVLVDAPPNRFGRDGALWHVRHHVVPGAVILLDDAARRRERGTTARWLAQYPGLTLVHYAPALGGRGLAVLQHSGSSARNLAIVSFLSSIAERCRSRAKHH